MGRIKAKAVNVICLSLTLQLKYSVLNERSPSNLWQKWEKKPYILKSLTNRLYLKK